MLGLRRIRPSWLRKPPFLQRPATPHPVPARLPLRPLHPPSAFEDTFPTLAPPRLLRSPGPPFPLFPLLHHVLGISHPLLSRPPHPRHRPVFPRPSPAPLHAARFLRRAFPFPPASTHADCLRPRRFRIVGSRRRFPTMRRFRASRVAPPRRFPPRGVTPRGVPPRAVFPSPRSTPRVPLPLPIRFPASFPPVFFCYLQMQNKYLTSTLHLYKFALSTGHQSCGRIPDRVRPENPRRLP